MSRCHEEEEEEEEEEEVEEEEEEEEEGSWQAGRRDGVRELHGKEKGMGKIMRNEKNKRREGELHGKEKGMRNIMRNQKNKRRERELHGKENRMGKIMRRLHSWLAGRKEGRRIEKEMGRVKIMRKQNDEDWIEKREK
ncbi:hypothetical protein Pmani_035060 [Petrolisthes manimaculis]|uniref:Uncharacterized protein n=1 Tax=Petrolisthes manimaculis TaxID=1843537 RepID=A0AAE1NN27_9EUCA|nr:hypothetical protein Pmani_035060 [Petrolisthes manimaculis]